MQIGTRQQDMKSRCRYASKLGARAGGGGSQSRGCLDRKHLSMPFSGGQSVMPVLLCTQGQSERLFANLGEEEEEAEEQVSSQI